MFDLTGKRGLVLGVANAHSIAFGCARACHDAGAELAVTFLNDKAEPFVRPLAEQLEASIILPCDVQVPGMLEALFDEIRTRWGRLDFVVHSIAFAPRDDLHGRVTDCSAAGFAIAMDVSCHSFIRVAKLAEPLMTDGGALITVSFYGAERAVPHYNLMGPVKAALETSVRYLSAELGPAGIRVNAISPGPLRTRAASGIDQFDALLERAVAETPGHHLVSIDQIGALAAFLSSTPAAGMNGEIIHVDGGLHAIG